MFKKLLILNALLFCYFGHGQSKTSLMFDALPDSTKGYFELILPTKKITPHYPFQIKHLDRNHAWVFCSKQEVKMWMEQGFIEGVDVDYEVNKALDDTANYLLNVDSVYEKLGDLHHSYTGKGVLIGYVDTGIDHNHPDFRKDGRTRVVAYWDQSKSDPGRTPSYGYGVVWYQNEIDDGTITSGEEQMWSHGTNVAAAGSSNGEAIGVNKGVAPESMIAIVKTDFNLQNWPLTVADACDFFFNLADSLGVPCVVNTSVGSYLGGHDALDPAGLYIDSLLEEPGRMVVGAMGNSGENWYHAGANLRSDTGLVVFYQNPTQFYSPNAFYYDLWADTADFKGVHWGYTIYDSLGAILDYTPVYSLDAILPENYLDTIHLVNGNKFVMEHGYSIENGRVHLEFLGELHGPDTMGMLGLKVQSDSLGHFDLWSGQWLGANKIAVDSLPVDPLVANHIPADSTMSIISSWASSEKVITVGNYPARSGIPSHTGNYYTFSEPLGYISNSSSKGPTRTGYMKPDVIAPGNSSVASSSLGYLDGLRILESDLLYIGGWHSVNGGTSMAAPRIAGSLALLLEQCPGLTPEEIKVKMLAATYGDVYTGMLPNYAYGNGKLNVYQLLLANLNSMFSIVGDSLICDDEVATFSADDDAEVDWMNGQSSIDLSLTETQGVYGYKIGGNGCKIFSDTIFLVKGLTPDEVTIDYVSNGVIVRDSVSNYDWYLNGLLIEEYGPRYQDNYEGVLAVSAYTTKGCGTMSNTLTLPQPAEVFGIYPNPSIGVFNIASVEGVSKIEVFDTFGRSVYYNYIGNPIPVFTVDLSQMVSGVYAVRINESKEMFQIVISK